MVARYAPEDRRYTQDHEWARAEGGRVRVGITDYAQAALGDVVFVEQPEVGRVVAQGYPCAVVESVKSVSEIYAPVGGRIVEVNEDLDDEPELVNSEPYDGGWFFVLEPSDAGALDGLLDAAAYRELTAE